MREFSALKRNDGKPFCGALPAGVREEAVVGTKRGWKESLSNKQRVAWN